VFICFRRMPRMGEPICPGVRTEGQKPPPTITTTGRCLLTHIKNLAGQRLLDRVVTNWRAEVLRRCGLPSPFSDRMPQRLRCPPC
jgi:hypothetical protein